MASWFKRRPFIVGSAIAALVGAAIAVAVVSFIDGDESAKVPLNCSVYDFDESVRLTVVGTVDEEEAEGGCQTFASELSDSSSYWIVGKPPPPESEPHLICAQLGPEGEGGRVIVEENPEAFTSTAIGICGRLAHAGWTQDASIELGPWQRDYARAVMAQESIEAEEQEQREAEAAVIEVEEEAIYACQEKAEAAEAAELEAIERVTEERIEAAPESDEFRIEEEGWAEEEEAWESGEAAFEACEEE